MLFTFKIIVSCRLLKGQQGSRVLLNILNWSTGTIIGIIIFSPLQHMMWYSMGKVKGCGQRYCYIIWYIQEFVSLHGDIWKHGIEINQIMLDPIIFFFLIKRLWMLQYDQSWIYWILYDYFCFWVLVLFKHPHFSDRHKKRKQKDLL